jgi:hypothetical protein
VGCILLIKSYPASLHSLICDGAFSASLTIVVWLGRVCAPHSDFLCRKKERQLHNMHAFDSSAVASFFYSDDAAAFSSLNAFLTLSVPPCGMNMRVVPTRRVPSRLGCLLLHASVANLHIFGRSILTNLHSHLTYKTFSKNKKLF